MFTFNKETQCYHLNSNPEKVFTKEFLEDCISNIKPIRFIEEFVKFCNGEIESIKFDKVDTKKTYIDYLAEMEFE